jgi:histidyl-tRNA synthetase
MRIEPEKVRGFKDFLPPESEKRAEIKRIIREVFRVYGFLPVETPTIEFDELMRSDTLDAEDEAVSDRYRLKDKGGRNLGLRYEFTFQLARIFKQNPNLKLPFKRYQMGKVFRDEPVSKGRLREFTQCDADVIGDLSIEADAECLAMCNEIFKSLKIKPRIEVNNRKLINAIIESVKIQDKLSAMRELDKLDKIGEDQVKGNLRKIAETSQIITLFKLLEKPLDFFVKNLFEGSEDVKKLVEVGKDYGVKIRFNPYMIRGLAYYTGNIFEVKVEGGKDAICAGGRYDGIVGKYLGKTIPAVGISFGLERLSEFAQVKPKRTKVILLSLSQNKKTIGIAQKLRKGGVACLVFFGKPGKALDFANSLEIPYVVFVGKEEISESKYKLKDMKSGDEKLLSEKQLLSKLK